MLFKKYILPLMITLLFGGVYFYAAIPAINLRSAEFWSFFFFLILVYVVCHLIGRFGARGIRARATQHDFTKKPASKKCARLVVLLAAVLVLGAAAIGLSSSAIFHADRYQQMITVTDREFDEDIAELSFSQIPVVDKATAQRMGSRKLGDVVELVSQFDVSELYTQINYQQTPVRISPLEYSSFIKWFVNRDAGIPYYVSIDMATQETELVELAEGMKYSPSEYFGRNLLRHARFHYPTKMFDEASFEIDDSGKPYWILSTYTYTIGVLGGKDIDGIIMIDAITGESDFYPVAEIPAWVDQVYSADMVTEQINNWGAYTNGYWNSIFAQTGVIAATEGYNYIALDDDVWLFTGLTSVVSDESNIGFILVNLRTKESRRYNINGAEEFSAMASAEGKVQEKGYKSTFPILLNIDGTPTYFVSLKDNAGLVKAYGFVSVSSYHNVAVGDTIASAREEYVKLIAADQNAMGSASNETVELTGTVERISTAVKDGNSYYYICLAGSHTVYVAPVSVGDFLPLLQAGDQVCLTVPSSDKQYVEVLNARLEALAPAVSSEPSEPALPEPAASETMAPTAE